MFWPEVLKQNLGFKLGYRTNKFPDDEGTPLYFITCTLQITTKDLLLAILGNDIAQDRPWGLSRDATLLEQREGEFDGGVFAHFGIPLHIRNHSGMNLSPILFFFFHTFLSHTTAKEQPRKRRRTTIPEQPIRKEEIDSEALVFHEEVDEFDDYLETNKSEKNESFSHNEGKRQ
eukprot:TRINITY_DN469_c0_g1_i3.p2 TRINITY_DN469_c0_g1~~TRINITY_DN469_c0_g1_i3.p2  ORF type:complete len:174 (-),score=34.04 TRINITY_DN469_c0_g1_i3:968-1489(-)